MVTKQIKCNLCNSTNYEILYSGKTKDPKNPSGEKKAYSISEWNIQQPEKLVKCNNCGLVFALQDRNLRYYVDAYSKMVDKEYREEEQGRRRASVEILKRIKKYKNNGKLLDIGCATGFLLDEARRRNWEVYGVEISKWASNYAREKLDLNVVRGPLKKTDFPDKYFDAIVMLDVLEHLTNPKYALLEIRRILKSDGILYISTPNINSLLSRILKAKWWGINKFHLFYFSKRTLEKMLDACGFKVKKYKPHIRIFSIKYWAKRLKAYSVTLYRILDFISRIDHFGRILLGVNLHDQIETVAVKARKLDYLANSVTTKNKKVIKKNMKVIVVLPAYNAEKTLKRTFDDIPKDIVDEIILVDDKSKDKTVKVAKALGLEIVQHKKNIGYGGNQKTCYKKALEQGADIVVMVHPDYQYDPTIIPKLIEPIRAGRADAVFGSRMMKGGALEGGMPLWKHNTNILLTAFENVVLGTYLTEYHSGFRAYSADLLRTVNFELNSNNFVFDAEIIVQTLIYHFKIEEIPIQTRYFDEASKIKFLPSIGYGLGIIWTMTKYLLHIKGIYKFRQFE
ncbi:MAG: methyltransferase domain-containing protein [Candidatus Omnitrophica bacterium]|nr:methyltransferase domain-containing protein [Candidatus Omnitrophota bacterium]